MVTPIVMDVLGTIPKDLVKEDMKIEGRVETI